MRAFACIFAAATLTGCTLDDLYVRDAGRLRIEGSWEAALGASDMTGEATAVLYDTTGSYVDYFNTPDHVIVSVPDGPYQVLVFNGAMFSERQTNLDNIFFRNTSAPDLFEAVASRSVPNARLARADEYVASNDMEPLATAWGEAEVARRADYRMKYRNGRPVDYDPEAWADNTLSLEARPLTWYIKVVVYVDNPASAKDAVGALRGLVRSRLAKSGDPTAEKVAYHIPFNALYIDRDTAEDGTPTGRIETPAIVTFGPPSDAVAGGDWTCEFELDVLLQDGSTYRRTFDVRRRIVDLIRTGRAYNSRVVPHIIEIGDDTPSEKNPEPDPFSAAPFPFPHREPIPLPYIEQAVGVDPWDDGETIIIRPENY